MERDTLSFRQQMALLWGALLSPAAELLPGQAAQDGLPGMLAILAAGVFMACSGLLLGALARPAGGLAQGLMEGFGSLGGRLCLFIYIVWGEVLLTLRLRLSAQRLLGAGERDGAVWFFLIVMAGMAVWMARGQLGALGRCAQLMFTALVCTAGAVLLLGLSQIRGENLLPDRDWTALGAARSVLPGMGALGYGLFVGFLIQPGEEEHPRRRWLVWTAWGCVALGLAQTILVGCFGPKLTLRLSSPFFQLAKSVGVEGAFQRLESLVTAIWTFSDLLLLAVILWGIRRAAAALWPKASPKAVVAMAAAPAAVVALALFDEGLSARSTAEILLPGGSVVLGIVVPLWAYGMQKWRKEHK